MLMVLGGCDSELWQPNYYPENPEAPSGGEEYVRIFVRWAGNYNYLNVDDLVPVEVERVAHANDNPRFDESRVRCMSLSILATGSLLTGLDSGGDCQHAGDAGPDGGAGVDYCEVDNLSVNLDRGGTFATWIRSTDAGTGVLRAELLSQRCSNTSDASVIAHDEVLVSFVSTGEDNPDNPADGDADADFDEWGY
jgi:hypothetical protein